MHTLNENYRVESLVTPQLIETDLTTDPLDLGPNFYDDVLVVLSVGEIDGTLDVSIETSDLEGGTYTEIGAFDQFTNADDNSFAVLGLNLQGKNSNGEEQRFLRAVCDISSTDDCYLSIVVLIKAIDGHEELNSLAPTPAENE